MVIKAWSEICPQFSANSFRLRKKLTSRVALLRRLAGSGWGAGATTLRTATLALVHSTAEYCAPVWCRSAHTRLIDPTINDALRIVTGMPASCTSGQPSNPSRHPTCWASSQSCHTISRTPCHGAWTPAPLSARPSIGCSCTAHQIETPICTRRTTHQFFWQHTCGAVWADNPTRLRTSIPDTGTHTPGMTVPRRTWVRLNRLRTGVGRFRSCLYKWGMASSVACERRTNRRPCRPPLSNPSTPHGLHGLTVLDHETTECLLNTCPDI